MKNTGKFLDFIGQSLLILAFGLIGIGCASFLLYIFTWPGMFGGPPLPFRIFFGIIAGSVIIGIAIGTVRNIWYLYEEYKRRSS